MLEDLLLQREQLASSSTSEIADDLRRSKPRSVTSNDDWKLGINYPQHEPSPETATPDVKNQDEGTRGNGETESFYGKNLARTENSTVPNRYCIRQEGKARVLTCMEAPTIMIRAERRTRDICQAGAQVPSRNYFSRRRSARRSVHRRSEGTLQSRSSRRVHSIHRHLRTGDGIGSQRSRPQQARLDRIGKRCRSRHDSGPVGASQSLAYQR